MEGAHESVGQANLSHAGGLRERAVPVRTAGSDIQDVHLMSHCFSTSKPD